MSTSKANYRVYNKFTKCYLSNGRKRVWHREAFVATFIKEMTNGKQGRYSIDDLEVHKFPLENAIVIDPRKFIIEINEKADESAKKKLKTASEYEKRQLLKRQADLEAELEKLKKEIAEKL